MTGHPLRLLYLLPAEGFGGAERQGIYHLAGLPKLDVAVTACVGPSDSVARLLDGERVAYQRVESFPDRTHSPLSWREDLGYLGHWLSAVSRAASEIEERLGGARFDLVFANRTFGWLVAALLCRRLRVPYVIRAGSRPAHSWLGVGLPLLDRLARPAALFYNCDAVRLTISGRLRCPELWLPNAVDTERFRPGPVGRARRRLGLPSETPLVGLAARPAPEKGFEMLCRVIRRVGRANARARFVVAGEFGWRSYYEARLRAAGLGDAVRFLGHVTAMPDFFRAMDVVVLTSRRRSIEASPNALLEAMASGRPVVATEVGGVPELVRDGVEGYLTEDGDDESFAGRVLDLLDSPERRSARGRAGRARALERHGASLVVGRLAETLRRLAFAPSASPDVLCTGAMPCESITPSVPPSICWFEDPRSRSSSSSPGAAI